MLGFFFTLRSFFYSFLGAEQTPGCLLGLNGVCAEVRTDARTPGPEHPLGVRAGVGWLSVHQPAKRLVPSSVGILFLCTQIRRKKPNQPPALLRPPSTPR